jgi:hypothetical protein
MNPWLVGLGMGLLGLMKSKSIDEPRANRERDLAAKTQELSPWTGLRANPVNEANPLDDFMQYGATGLMIGDKMSAKDVGKEIKKDAIKKQVLEASTKPAPNPWGISLGGGNMLNQYNDDIWG